MSCEASKFLINEDPIFFLPTLAVGIGLNEAILLQKIHGWLRCTPIDQVGRSWIYNSYKSWHEQLPFMSEITIKRAMKNLIDKGIVLTENFNKKSFDKTLWYSIDYEKLDEVVCTIDSIKMIPREYQNDTTNTNNKYNKENINNINIINTKERFTPPTLIEVKNYISENNLNVDGETFYSYFTEGNWKDSRGNKVKNWKQKLRTWSSYGKTGAAPKEVPKWFGADNQLKETTQEDIDEMEALLNEL